jgi:hypothetical protein
LKIRVSVVRFRDWPPKIQAFSLGQKPGLFAFRVLASILYSSLVNFMRSIALAVSLAAVCSGCAVVAVADAAVTVVATTVKVGAAVVGTTVDVAAAGVKAVAGSDEAAKDQ